MNYLDLTLPTPEENLACDEALLDLAEAGHGSEVLRFWQPADHFLVVGYSNKLATEVNLDQARQDSVPVLRRCTGGGSVLQGPGCLNYSLILRIPEQGPLAHIRDTNALIMEKHRQALAPLLGTGIQTVCVQGHSDLTLGDLKFSGNAQRRRRRHLLFHGSFLLQLDVDRITRLLPMPSREPDYRRRRPHQDFLINTELAAQTIQQQLRQAWSATAPLTDVPLAQIETLARDQYRSDAWNRKF